MNSFFKTTKSTNYSSINSFKSKDLLGGLNQKEEDSGVSELV